MSRTTEIYSIWPPTMSNELISQQMYEHWQFPTSFSDVWNFIINFNGEHQPLIHDYPFIIPAITIPCYLAFVYFGPKLMKNRKPFELRRLLQLWNLFLAVLSAYMFFGLFQPMLNLVLRVDLYHLVCLPEKDLLYGSPFCMIWIFCLSKFIELIDTVFLVLRKREVEFLHWYHHTTVLIYTWYSLVIIASVGSIFGCINSFVHTFMYFYFFLTSCGYRPSWGKLITIMQITQMLLGIGASSLWSYYYLFGDFCPVYSEPSVWFAATLALYGSYFYLFYQFYKKRYNPRKASSQPKTNNKKNNTKTTTNTATTATTKTTKTTNNKKKAQ